MEEQTEQPMTNPIDSNNPYSRKVLYWLSRATSLIGFALALESFNRKNYGLSYRSFIYIGAILIWVGIFGKKHFAPFVPPEEIRTGQRIYWIFMAAVWLFLLINIFILKKI